MPNGRWNAVARQTRVAMPRSIARSNSMLGWGRLGALRRHTLSDTENQIPIVKTYSRASMQARKHFFISSPARWGANTFT